MKQKPIVVPLIIDIKKKKNQIKRLNGHRVVCDRPEADFLLDHNGQKWFHRLLTMKMNELPNEI
jgi:hypothetical protein